MLYPELGNCARCGDVARDRHHKDGNGQNDDPANVEVLCRLCHLAADGRLPILLRLAIDRRAACRG